MRPPPTEEGRIIRDVMQRLTSAQKPTQTRRYTPRGTEQTKLNRNQNKIDKNGKFEAQSFTKSARAVGTMQNRTVYQSAFLISIFANFCRCGEPVRYTRRSAAAAVVAFAVIYRLFVHRRKSTGDGRRDLSEAG